MDTHEVHPSANSRAHGAIWPRVAVGRTRRPAILCLYVVEMHLGHTGEIVADELERVCAAKRDMAGIGRERDVSTKNDRIVKSGGAVEAYIGRFRPSNVVNPHNLQTQQGCRQSLDAIRLASHRAVSTATWTQDESEQRTGRPEP